MVGGGGDGGAQGYDFTKRATRFENSFADGDGDSAKGAAAVPITVLPDKVTRCACVRGVKKRLNRCLLVVCIMWR